MKSTTKSHVLLLIGGLFLSASASAEKKISPQIGVHEEEIRVNGDVVVVQRSPFNTCDAAMHVMLEPAASVTIERQASYKMVLVESRDVSRVVQFALEIDGKYWCSETGRAGSFESMLKPGNYKIFAMGNSLQPGTNKTFTYRLITSMAVKDERSPSVQSDFSASNPTSSAVTYGGDFVSLSLVAPRLKKQLKRNKKAHVSAVPIGTLNVARKSTYAFSVLPNTIGFVLLSKKASHLIESWDGGISLSKLELDAGEYRLFALGPKATKKQSGTLFVRDIKAPTTANPYAVAAPDAQRVDFELGQQTVVKATMKDSVGGWKSGCGEKEVFAFPKKAPLVLTLNKGTKGMVIDYVYNAREMALAILSKDAEPRCFYVDDDKSPASMAHYLDPGTYYISVGFKAGYTGEAALMVREASTPVTSESFVREIPQTLSANERDVARYMPFIIHMNPGREELSRVFAELPQSLWFYARYELDGAVAKSRSALSRGILPDASDLKGFAYPIAGEPLVKIGDKFVTADGLIFQISPDAVVPAFKGTPVLPKKMRNLRLSLVGDDLQYASASFLKKVDKLAKAKEKFGICYRKYLQKHGGYTNLQEVTFRGNKVISVESLGSKAARNGFARCRGKRVEATERRLTKQLSRDFSRRGQKRLKGLHKKMEAARPAAN